MDGTPARWVSVNELIDLTDLSRPTIYRRLRGPDPIPSKKNGGRRLFYLPAVYDWLERQQDPIPNRANSTQLASTLSVMLWQVIQGVPPEVRRCGFRASIEIFIDIPPSEGAVDAGSVPEPALVA